MMNPKLPEFDVALTMDSEHAASLIARTLNVIDTLDSLEYEHDYTHIQRNAIGTVRRLLLNEIRSIIRVDITEIPF